MMDSDKYPLGQTLDNGNYVFRELLGGVLSEGLWRGTSRNLPERQVVITFRSNLLASQDLRSLLDYEVPGIAPLLFVGSPDGYRLPSLRSDPGWQFSAVELRPLGTSLHDIGALNHREVIRLGIGLCNTILAWDDRASITRGLRPETVYVTGKAGDRCFSGSTPRCAFLLNNAGMYRAFSRDCYRPPADNDYMEIAVDDEVFVVGLLMWFALHREHAYAVPGHPNQHDNIWEDVRHPFTGPPELGRLFDAVLVADPDKRIKAAEFRVELERLARTWNVELPPFPPPGLAELADGS